MLVTFTGGEPTLRRDLEDIVAEVDRAIALKYVTLITHGAMLTPERAAVAMGCRASTSSTSRSTISTSATTRRAAFPGLRAKILARDSGDARARHRQHPLQHRHQERQPRSDRADRAARAGARRRRELQRLHRLQERQSRVPASRRRPSRASSTTSSRELLDIQAPPARRDHELRLLSRADSAVRARRDDASPVGRASARSTSIPTGHVKRCPDFPTDFHWRDFQEIQTDRTATRATTRAAARRRRRCGCRAFGT